MDATKLTQPAVIRKRWINKSSTVRINYIRLQDKVIICLLHPKIYAGECCGN